MNQKRELKNALEAAIATTVDSVFSEHEFNRKTGSLRFERMCDSSVQSLDIRIEHHPRDNTSAAAAVYPWVEVSVPAVDQFVALFAEQQPTLVNAERKTLVQPLGFLSQKKDPARWFIYQQESIREFCSSLVDFSKHWFFPFAASWKTTHGLIVMYEKNDETMIHDREQFVRIFACYLAENDLDGAENLLANKFGRGGAKRKYSFLYDALVQRRRGFRGPEVD